MRPTIPVMVIEDNRLLRDGLAAILAAQSDLTVVAVAASAEAAIASARETHPRVILMDGALGDSDSRACLATLREEVPEARIIVMDLLPMSEDVVEFVRAGAAGFIVKDASIEEVLGAVRSVAEGKQVLPPALTRTVFSHITKQAVDRASPDVTGAVQMTPREREVIDLIAQGLSNKEIAHRLNLTTYTVKSHVHNILEKLALHSRLQVAAHANLAARRERP